MILTILCAVLLIVSYVALAMSLRRDLTMFQQNSYRPSRYRHWMSESG